MTLNIPDFGSATVIVAGDAMLDRYWFGPTGRISPEAPVPVVRISGVEDRPGGAANVAVNLADLGVATRLCGCVGSDDTADQLQKLLRQSGVEDRLVRVDGHETVTKLRVLSRNQQLIRLDFEPERAPAVGDRIINIFDDWLDSAGAAVLSDYGKGSMDQARKHIASCRAAGVPVLVDPKGSDFGRYKGATVVTPNLAEFEAVVGTCDSDAELAKRARRLARDHDIQYLLITRSDKGMILVGRDDSVHELAAEAREIFDVTGAGDTVIAATAAGLAAGQTMTEAASLANLAAGLVVRKLGVSSVTASELRLALHQRGKGGRRLLDQSQLIEAVRQARERGEKIVMTNGCFDILHAGHIAYLEEAKTLGDRLIVAVNDDQSVQRLKGSGRPINRLEDRLAVLSGLAAVNWVVPFAEDTPAALVGDVLPDVLVKGGDYRPDDIAGAADVLQNGGEVKVLAYREGSSTSEIVDRIRGGSEDR
jgi:D-beta-D-heptose 7-phosphate kinase/D-beta-D-heptose 1-phosphate adenosyltransferase